MQKHIYAIERENMTLEEMRKIKDKRGYSFAVLSKYSGVPAITLRKIFSGMTKNPRQATLDAIERVLTSDENVYRGKAHDYIQNRADFHGDMKVADEGPAFGGSESGGTHNHQPRNKRQGEYTLEDYYALPEDVRAELIDGELFIMEVPYLVHQDITSYVHMVIYNYIRKNKGNCKVYESPIDIQLDMDDKTMVEPDVVVICDKDKIKRKKICGAPDFVLEVLSKSTKGKDMLLKSYKYIEAGVSEYWMIDPDKKLLIKYDFSEGESIPMIKALKGQEPVLTFNGKLLIDLEEIEAIINEYESIPEE